MPEKGHDIPASAGQNDNDAADSASLDTLKKSWYRSLPKWVYTVALGGTALTALGAAEMYTSFGQSFIFNAAANGTLFSSNKTIDSENAPMAQGPYDVRHGYSDTLRVRERLLDRGYTLAGDTTWTQRSLFGMTLFPLYDEKSQVGLTIRDQQGSILHDARFPRNVYESFDDIPPLLVKSLLYVENRKLLNDSIGSRNPAIEWERLFFAIKSDLSGNGGAGASTLATQTEKFRHSPDGETSGDKVEKLRQMASASVRAYSHGRNTSESRRDIVLDYINGIPLSAVPGFGEVHGFSDGLRAWFGRDPVEANRLLAQDDSQLTDEQMREKALVYRETLSIAFAVKKPTAYFRRDRDELEQRIDNYLPLLAEQGIISERLRDATLGVRVQYADPSEIRELYRTKPDPQKARSAMQIDMMKLFGLQSLYQLNRYDITATTTLDVDVDREISKRLHEIKDPETAASYGLTGYRLLPPAMTQDVTYTFTMYERMPDGRNVLRVQADNLDGQFNLNEDSKLELGSTAKLRTMVTYLEVMAELHERFEGWSPARLQALRIHEDDNLTQFAVDYLSAEDTDKSLDGMLEAALDRRYSASPNERFFTGGGVHRFSNFDSKSNGLNATVKTSLHQSLNLPFVRIMRDLVNYNIHQKMNVDPDIYTNPDSEDRKEYLEKFASREGTIFLWRGWKDLEGKSIPDMLDVLAEDTRKTPTQLAVVYRSVIPGGNLAGMTDYINKHCTSRCRSDQDYADLYEDHGPGKFNLHDRGYLTNVHPLKLWLGTYLAAHPESTWAAAKDASAETRVEVYDWLINSDKMQGQNTRIRSVVEAEAFTYIHASWEKNGFPFSRMTPSYASALGSSGDTPAALATLSGILQNNGLLVPSVKYTEIRFAENTPYSMIFNAAAAKPERVMPAAVARLARREMQNVVEMGTARRAHESIRLSDGTILPVGAKTGTGDNRIHRVSAGGRVIGSEVRSRTATFVYAIDDRFYGTVTAFVDGPSAARYRFTSGLTAQLFKSVIAPELTPLLDRSYGVQTMDMAQRNVPAANVQVGYRNF